MFWISMDSVAIRLLYVVQACQCSITSSVAPLLPVLRVPWLKRLKNPWVRCHGRAVSDSGAVQYPS